jgi:hypothetical protein
MTESGMTLLRPAQRMAWPGKSQVNVSLWGQGGLPPCVSNRYESNVTRSPKTARPAWCHATKCPFTNPT